MNVNKVMVLGRLTRDPEVKYSTSGNAFCTWGLAINRYYNSPNSERQQEVCFIDCKAFGRQAEIVSEYVRKGNPLFVEGRLSFYQYETESGEKRNKLSVIAERVQLMGQGMVEGQQSHGTASGPPDNIEPVNGEAEQPPPEPNGHNLSRQSERSSETENDIPF